jgi:hypothetical protein
MNPDRMRGTYGKLMYMLQDTQNRLVRAARLWLLRGDLHSSDCLMDGWID